MRESVRYSSLATGLAAFSVILFAGCSFDGGGVASFDASAASADAPADNADARPGVPDAQPPADAEPCQGELLTLPFSNVADCDIPKPLGPLTLTGDEVWFLDTDDGTVRRQRDDQTIEVASTLVAQVDGGPMVRVVTVTDLLISNPPGNGFTTLGIFGKHPLIIVVTGDATIDGFLYGGANRQSPGPGGNSAECGNGVGTAGPVSTGGSGFGGGGGAFGSVGGNGSKSSGTKMGPEAPVAGGQLNGNNLLRPLRGGCAGGAGGNSGGPGGGGGGAIQFIVEGTLLIRGAISVAGGGGLPPQPGDNQPEDAGGGGGGAGGALLFQANTLTVNDTAIVVSHGGGGGEGTLSGGDEFGGDPGEAGHSDDKDPAEGGGADSSSAGGDGGDGAVGGTSAEDATLGTTGDSTDAGGGGGGGGVGRIRFSSLNADIDGSALISPIAQ